MRKSGPVKWQKHKISKNEQLSSSKGTWVHVYQFLGQLDKFLGLDRFSTEIFFQTALAKIEKNWVFWAKIGQKYAKFSKILEIDKNHINA